MLLCDDRDMTAPHVSVVTVVIAAALTAAASAQRLPNRHYGEYLPLECIKPLEAYCGKDCKGFEAQLAEWKAASTPVCGPTRYSVGACIGFDRLRVLSKVIDGQTAESRYYKTDGTLVAIGTSGDPSTEACGTMRAYGGVVYLLRHGISVVVQAEMTR